MDFFRCLLLFFAMCFAAVYSDISQISSHVANNAYIEPLAQIIRDNEDIQRQIVEGMEWLQRARQQAYIERLRSIAQYYLNTVIANLQFIRLERRNLEIIREYANQLLNNNGAQHISPPLVNWLFNDVVSSIQRANRYNRTELSHYTETLANRLTEIATIERQLVEEQNQYENYLRTYERNDNFR